MSRAIQLWRYGRAGMTLIRDHAAVLSQTQALFRESPTALSPCLQYEKKEALRTLSWTPLSRHLGIDVQTAQWQQPSHKNLREFSSSSVWSAVSESRTEETKPSAGGVEEEQGKPPASVEDLKKTITELEAKNKELLEERDSLQNAVGTLTTEGEEVVKDLKDKLVRTFADMENLRERTQRELDSLKKYANQEFAKDLLEVADYLALAQASVPEAFRKPGGEQPDAAATSKLLASLLTGVEMTEKELMRVFKKHGLERFDPTGEPFNPNAHMAQFEVADETKTPGTISMVTKVGYTLHSRVIRPAGVGIVRDPEA
eukprot:TRINITY_DN7748_c0_g1_i1.p1 TRINITY_DN7748_c0_g1~~TRINITY_DN7748_c0_g1_i1.p1  ORF type:complete len:315 (+),score=66.43 TRINITY_DN7748_c0_g1_i1:80-1024(+)